MTKIKAFKNFGIKSGKTTYANIQQIKELYHVPKKTLYDNITRLKKDGLINGAKIRTLAQDGKNRELEVFTLEETISIGFRLRSEMALQLQQYASKLVIAQVEELKTQKRALEIELSVLWNKIDTEDLYRV